MHSTRETPGGRLMHREPTRGGEAQPHEHSQGGVKTRAKPHTATQKPHHTPPGQPPPSQRTATEHPAKHTTSGPQTFFFLLLLYWSCLSEQTCRCSRCTLCALRPLTTLRHLSVCAPCPFASTCPHADLKRCLSEVDTPPSHSRARATSIDNM